MRLDVNSLNNEVRKFEDKADRILAAAVWYVDHGIPILPADSSGKLPGSKYGSWNYNNPITDVAKAIELFGKGGMFKGWNISVPTGPKSGIAVVDIDNKHGKNGSDAFASLEGIYGELPEDVLTATTPSGGIHLFFKYSEGFYSTNPMDATSPGLLPGIDTRGGKRGEVANGGHVLIFPSIKTVDGEEKGYRWASEDGGKLEIAPDWVINLINGTRPILADSKVEIPDVIPEGGRDSFLYNFGLRLLARGYNDVDVESHMRRVGDKFSPPSPAMVEAKIRQVLSSQIHEKMELLKELSGNIARSEKTGGILPTVSNFYELVKSNLFKTHARLAFDLFRDKMLDLDDRTATVDDIYNKVEFLMSKEFKIEKIRAIITNHTTSVVRRDNTIDTLKQYFDSLKWDGVDRIGQLCNKLGIHEEQEYYLLYRSYVRKWLIAGAARTYSPNAKVDNIFVLIGKQGTRKSSFFKFLTPGEHPEAILAKNPQIIPWGWFTDAVGKEKKLSHPDEARKLQGKFMGEMAEMHAMSRNEITEIKHFLSEQAGDFIPKFKEDSKKIPRRFVLAGTSNKKDYLGDETGNRRFWNLFTGTIVLDTQWAYENRDQIWAQAKDAYERSEVWWLTAEETAMQDEDNKQYEDHDSWESVILAWAANKSRFTKADAIVYALDFAVAQIKQQDQSRVTRILSRYGWENKQVQVINQTTNERRYTKVLVNPNPDVDAQWVGRQWSFDASKDENNPDDI